MGARMYSKNVFMYVDEILHDIDAELLKFSKLIAVDGNANLELQTDETANNRPLIVRRIAYHIGQLSGIMQAYIVELDKKAVTNEFRNTEEYEFKLSFPENWNTSAFLRLPVEMQSYVVNGCIADFLKSSYPNQAAIYQSVADSSLWNVKHCVTTRVPESMKKPQTMF